MANIYSYVPYKETGYFSRLVTDYLSGHPDTRPFYDFTPDASGIARAIGQRRNYPVNREVLVNTLKRQYSGLSHSEKTEENIRLLSHQNTFTICTAHQPNLLTGYLYFIYKIIHAIKLAEELSNLYPGNHFVPVYYMGSEDNDIDELGTFRFRGDKFVWDGSGQSGAVGRMDTAGLKPLINSLFKQFGPPGKNCDDLLEIITEAYAKQKTIGAATQYLVNALFGRFGLVVLDPDDAEFKKSFVPVMEDELLNKASYPVITGQIEKLGEHYKIQAHPREINLFYLADQLRERIERNGEKWVVLNTAIEWTKNELLKELNEHPERFSPNVMLRGLYQETILPNAVFIGGGAEVAYWLQLKPLFEHYKVFYPAVHLRQSVMWVENRETKLREKLDFSIKDIFRPEPDLQKYFVANHAAADWQTGIELQAIESVFSTLKAKASAADSTLGPAAEAVITKMRYQLQLLEKKMLRAEKKKMQVQMDRITSLKNALFPAGGLQERIENFMDYWLIHGSNFIDTLKNGMHPLEPQFMIIESE